MPSRRGPLDFVQIVAPPGGSYQGLKIQARNATLYNATLPSRQEIRKGNYDRRLDQLTARGFKSLIHKPYRPIGDPLYLEQKQLILTTLGQWNEGEELPSSGKSEDEDGEDDEGKKMDHLNNAKPEKTAKFVLRRARKDLHTLNQEAVHCRDIIRNVSLGHGLFHLLQKEKTMKAEEQIRQKEDRLKNQLLPPRNSSSESESEDDFDMAVNCASGDSTPVARPLTSSSRGSSRRSRKNAHRPYTAHANISQSNDGHRETIFRQLCALYWLLEAMNAEATNIMAPIITSWSFKDVASNKTRYMKQDREKIESRWKSFLTEPIHRAANRRTSSIHMLNRGVRRTSAFPSAITSRTIAEEDEFPARHTEGAMESSEDKLMSDYGVKIGHWLTIRRSHERVSVISAPSTARNSPRRTSVQPEPRPTASLPEEEDEEESPTKVKNSRNLFDTRPKTASSLDVAEYQASANSHRVQSMPQDMRQQFVEIQEEKSLTMHDALEVIDRERIGKLQNKFLHMPTTQTDFFKAVQTMRAKSSKMDLQKAKSQRHSSVHKQWYTDLLRNVPDATKKDWYIERILAKLSKYGMIQCRKQNVFRFLKTLEGLRLWEICAPDVCAAVEFCRERIVDMPVEEYEEWFRSRFPAVDRPQTAAPSSGGGGEKRPGLSVPVMAVPRTKSAVVLSRRK